MEHILIVDDEAAIRELLQDYFELEGYRVSTAENGQAALKKVETGPDLILLDINMPGLDGLSVCRRIRQFVSCPILFLTARVEDADKLIGFGAGGDDYIVKPFNLDILGAQVAAHLRRESRAHTKAKAHFSGELVLDYAARAAYYKGTPIPLAKKEFDIVELLSLNAGQVFDKERIYEKLWGYDSEGDSAVVAEHIRRIRNKFTAAGGGAPIETVWGVGYKWVS